MRIGLSAALSVGILATAASLGFAQAKPSASSIEGVWRVTELVRTGANASTNSSPQPSLYIFTKGHYSLITVNGTKPRTASAAAKDPNKLTDAEKLARYEEWEAFSANAGTYEIKGTTLSRRALVAKSVSVMTATSPSTSEFKVDGKTLVLVSKSAAGQPASELRTTLTRVE
jgi:hypothetical protein